MQLAIDVPLRSLRKPAHLPCNDRWLPLLRSSIGPLWHVSVVEVEVPAGLAIQILKSTSRKLNLTEMQLGACDRYQFTHATLEAYYLSVFFCGFFYVRLWL